MNNKIIDAQDVLRLSRERDDLDALSVAFSLPPLDYIDISRQEALQKMMNRWPLLDELARFNDGNDL